MLGVARIILDRGFKNAEFSVLVGDSWQGKGIGAELLRNCLQIAKQRGINTIWGQVLAENTQMLSLGKKLGFSVKRSSEPNAFELRIDLEKIGAI
jgi:acetyltransferase